MKLYAIIGGGDWSDASVDHLMIPDGLDVAAERERYKDWLRHGYDGKYKAFTDWLKERGAEEPGDDVLKVFWDE